MRKQVQQFAAIVVFAASLFSFTACSSTAPAAGSTVSSSEQTVIYGKVTSVSGENVTMALGTLKKGKNRKQKTSSGNGVNPETSKSGNNKNQAATSSNGNTSSNASGAASGGNARHPNKAKGMAPIMLALTGETKTITITDTGILTKPNRERNRKSNGQTNSSANAESESPSSGSAGVPASMADITKNSILKVTYDANTQKLISVEILREAKASS